MANALDRLLGMLPQQKKFFFTYLALHFIYFLILYIGSKEEELDSDDLDDDDDEVEEEEEEVGAEASSCEAETNGTETLDGLRSYMDQMDQELMNTNIGQSFSQTVKCLSLLIHCPPVSES